MLNKYRNQNKPTCLIMFGENNQRCFVTFCEQTYVSKNVFVTFHPFTKHPVIRSASSYHYLLLEALYTDKISIYICLYNFQHQHPSKPLTE